MNNFDHFRNFNKNVAILFKGVLDYDLRSNILKGVCRHTVDAHTITLTNHTLHCLLHHSVDMCILYNIDNMLRLSGIVCARLERSYVGSKEAS